MEPTLETETGTDVFGSLRLNVGLLLSIAMVFAWFRGSVETKFSRGEKEVL